MSDSHPYESQNISLPAINTGRSPSVKDPSKLELTKAGVKSPKNYGFEISPGGYQRRVNKDGVHMLEAILQKRETDKQVKMLQNRIKRLQYEDERANKKIMETQRKTEQMLKVKERRQQDLEFKLNHKKEQLSNMMNNRQRFIEEKERRNQSIKNALTDMRVRNNVIQKEIMDNRNRNNDYIHKFMSDERERKYSLRMKNLDERRKKRDNLNDNRSLHNKSVSDDFNHRQVNNKMNAKMNLEYMKQLEEKESQMIEKLKHTFQVQQTSFNSFEAVANSSIQAAGRSSVAARTTGGFMDRGNLTSAAGLKSAKGGLRNEGDAASHYSHDVDNMTAQPEVGDRLGRLIEEEQKMSTELREVEAMLNIGGISLMKKQGTSSKASVRKSAKMRSPAPVPYGTSGLSHTLPHAEAPQRSQPAPKIQSRKESSKAPSQTEIVNIGAPTAAPPRKATPPPPPAPAENHEEEPNGKEEGGAVAESSQGEEIKNGEETGDRELPAIQKEALED